MAGSTVAVPIKRLNVNLPEPAYEELQKLSAISGRSMTEVVRTALGLAKVAFEEDRAGNRLAVIDRDGVIRKEIVLPQM